MKHIPITDLDQFGPEEITVRHTGTLPDYYMRNVIDLASIVGTHNVAREAYISEYTPFYFDTLVA